MKTTKLRILIAVIGAALLVTAGFVSQVAMAQEAPDVTVVLSYTFDSVHQDVQEIQFNVGIYNNATPAQNIGYAVVNVPYDPVADAGRAVGVVNAGIDLQDGTMRDDIGNLYITTWFRKQDSQGRWMHFQPTTANDTGYPWLRVHQASVTTVHEPVGPLIAQE